MEYELLKHEETKKLVEDDLMGRSTKWSLDEWKGQLEGLKVELTKTEYEGDYIVALMNAYDKNPRQSAPMFEAHNEPEVLEAYKKIQMAQFEMERRDKIGQLESTHYQITLCEDMIKNFKVEEGN